MAQSVKIMCKENQLRTNSNQKLNPSDQLCGTVRTIIPHKIHEIQASIKTVSSEKRLQEVSTGG